MYNFFIDQAIKNINCSIYQDKQYVLKAKHICNTEGVLNKLEVLNRNLALPTFGEYYHVYQIGRAHPKQLGLLYPNIKRANEIWFNIGDTINELDLFVNLYTNDGVELPKFSAWYIFTNEGDLLLAVAKDKNIPIDYVNDVYFRVYTNAYYSTLRADQGVEVTYYEGKIVSDNSDILRLQLVYHNHSLLDGYVFAYVNGYKVEDINLLTASPGDTVELLYDSSVKKVVTLSVEELETFISTRDTRNKYLVHYPDDTQGFHDEIIDYQDDIDIHVIYDGNTSQDNFGVYYHRNSEDSVRMVTHRDYSVPVDYVVNLATYLNSSKYESLVPITDMKLELKIRDSGFERPLIYDSNRLFELYKLDDESLTQALLGINSVVDIWKAANLENSIYSKIMGMRVADISIFNVEEAYGYNGLSKVVADTPSGLVRELGLRTLTLPYLLRSNSTLFKYNHDGHLIDTEYHAIGDRFITNDNDIKYVEVIKGRGSTTPGVIFGTDNITLPTSDYRVYRNFLGASIDDDNWEDITNTNKYTVVDGVLKWGGTEFNQILMVRDSDTFLLESLSVPIVEGNLFFTLAESEDRGDNIQPYSLPIPLGQLDIWLNGRSLIKDLDYKVVFPKVYILNKKYLIQPAGTTYQSVVYRYTGFANSDLVSDPDEDTGFIEHGVLSNNNKFDIRDDKVMRITVDGSLKTRNELTFSELHDGVSVVNTTNGLPYQIKDVIVPLGSLVSTNTYELREDSKAIDKIVSDYLSIKIPQPERNGLSVIASRYPLVSPFIATIISHLVTDIITVTDISNLNNDTEINEYLSSYHELLEFDPIAPLNRANEHYTVIHPTNMDASISMSINKYDFLTKVVRIYAKGLIDLTNFITVTN